MEGTVFLASDIKKQLQEANKTYDNRKTWEELYGNISLQEQQAVSNLDYDYSKAVSEAYASSLKQNAAIAGSNLGQGFKAEAISNNDILLNQAYEQYKQNYYNNLQNVENTYGVARNQISEALLSEAENYSKLTKKPYEYIQYLYNTYSADENSKYSKFLQPYITTADDGERLFTWDELANQGLFDQEGSLTEKGTNFYSTIMNWDRDNDMSLESFNSWLANTDEDLYNWFKSEDYYNYAPYQDAFGNIVNTKAGSFRQALGMEPGEEKQNKIRELETLTTDELNKLKQEALDDVIKADNKYTALQTLFKQYNLDISKYITEEQLENDLKHLHTKAIQEVYKRSRTSRDFNAKKAKVDLYEANYIKDYYNELLTKLYNDI